MNTKRTVSLFIALLVALVLGTTTASAQGPRNPTTPGAGLPLAVDSKLPDEVITAIKLGIMDEYHAYNIYQAVINQFGTVRPFTNIQNAEAQHISAWKVIFDRYGVAISASPALNPVPQFATIADACKAAADAEIANVKLYDQMLKTASSYPDIVQVINALRNASQYNHLPAFQRCALRY